MIENVLKKLDFSDKAIAVYVACMQIGPASVRRIADRSNVNRGTTYDALKTLQENGLVTYYHKDKHQYFIAEDPIALLELISRKKSQLRQTKSEIDEIMPELKSMHNKAGAKPVVKYYEGKTGIHTILSDVLDTCAKEKKEYRVYSSPLIKQYVYESYPSFSDTRIKKGITVRSISLGAGGSTVGLDERKWLSVSDPAPTYTIIYQGKVAMISIDAEGHVIGVLIEDQNTYKTQLMLFESMWSNI